MTKTWPDDPAGGTCRAPMPGHAGRWLERIAAGLLILMPLCVWAAKRSGPLVLSLAALALLGAAMLDGCLLGKLDRTRRRLSSPGALAALAFLALALISTAWSHAPMHGLRALLEFAVPLIAGFVVFMFLPQWEAGGTIGTWLAPACALALASLFTMAEIGSGMALRSQLGLRSNSYIFNPVLIACLLSAIPVCERLLRGPGLPARLAGLAAFAALAAAILTSESGAAVLGLGVGVLAYAAARLWPRLSVVVLAAGLVASLALAPVMGEILDRLLPTAAHEQLQASHSRDRVDIWRSFGAAARAQPWLGGGFGSSATFEASPAAVQVDPGLRALLGVGHPHSLPLQIWVELGAAGALIGALCGLGMIGLLAHIAPGRRAPALAMMASALAIASVGHGAWQAWWVAAIWTGVIWTARAVKE